MTEQWKKLFGNYEISNWGNLRNIRTGNSLKKEIDKNGYERITLWYNHKNKTFLVHRLVAEIFILNPNNYSCINHKDNNRQNNNVNNLEWCDYTYNNNYCYNQNRNPHKKLSDQDVSYIRENYEKIGCSNLANYFGVSAGLICDIAHYKKRV